MNRNRLPLILGAVLLMAITTLTLVGAASAQGHFKELYKFNGYLSTGDRPQSTPTLGPDGNLYGTTAYGGASEFGTVFQLVPNADGSWTENLLYSFTGGPDGSVPQAPVVFDSAGNLYGTATNGGDLSCDPAGCGVIFELTPNSAGNWLFSVLHTFTGPEGSYPWYSGVILDGAGNLYGTTFRGGAYGGGTAYKMAPNSDGTWTHSVIHDFGNGTDGIIVMAGLVFDAAGNLYGTTSNGGAYLYGTIFELKPNLDGTWTESLLHQFTNGNDGGAPQSGLIFDSTGNIYGATYGGGDIGTCGYVGCGIIFELKPLSGRGWKLYNIHTFIADGHGPNSLVFDAAGNLWGTAVGGGVYGEGMVFELKLIQGSRWRKYLIHSFGPPSGIAPKAGLMIDAAGNLYGTTSADSGNIWRGGTIFELTP